MPSPPAATPPVDPLAALYARVGGSMRYDLAGMTALLAALGHPERAMRHVLVVGTNGKGSTVALLADALARAGHVTGRFTSPHLVAYEERIAVNGVHISPQAAQDGLQALFALEPHLPRPMSFFEGTMALAALHFRAQGVGVAVWEAGLGGRLDATNALPSDGLAAVGVTPIGLDHQAILGHSLAAIAGEKAGVFRPQVPVCSAPQAEEAAEVLGARAEAAGAPLWTLAEGDVTARSAGLASTAPFLQVDAALADALGEAVDRRGIDCPADARLASRRAFAWPGRYQWLAGGTHGAAAVLLDGGHNPHGCAALAQALAADPRFDGKRLRLLLSASADKDLAAMAAPLLPRVAEVHVAPCQHERAASLQALCQALPGARAHDSVPRALAALLDNSQPTDVVLVAGSLLLVGEALAALSARRAKVAG